MTSESDKIKKKIALLAIRGERRKTHKRRANIAMRILALERKLKEIEGNE